MLEKLAKAPRWLKRLITVSIDIVSLVLIGVLGVWLRNGEILLNLGILWIAILLLPLVAIPVFIKQGLYRAVVRYIGFQFAITVFLSVSLAILIWSASLLMLEVSYPRSSIIIIWFVCIVYLAGSRIVARWLLSDFILDKHRDYKRVIIWGAGASGQQLLSGISKIKSIHVVAFIDDDDSLQNMHMGGMRVYAREDLEKIIRTTGATELFLAIPSITAKQKRKILDFVAPLPLKISTLPGIEEMVEGKISFSDVRELEIEDLLGRETIPPIKNLLDRCVFNKVVMITGAGGSIGSELCRQVIKSNPKVLILFELSEFALYSIEQELLKLKKDIQLIALIGNVNNEDKLHRVFNRYAVDTIYHAAAYKHVPLVEHNIREGLINNTYGTYVLARVAAEHKVKRFVLISTDKAVRPTNFMGASKRLSEMVLQALQDEYLETKFVMVRFGNVLGSSGSVIPLFRKQIASGVPITVTHKDITRYFMTIPEASALVIQAGAMGKGGDVFVLDMGESVKISFLAEQVIRLSGFEPVDEQGNGDIEIKYTGLRPGEKLYEELLIGENIGGTEHPRIMKAHEDYLDMSSLQNALDGLKVALDAYDFDKVESQVKMLVSGFSHESGNVDYLH